MRRPTGTANLMRICKCFLQIDFKKQLGLYSTKGLSSIKCAPPSSSFAVVKTHFTIITKYF